VAARCTSPTSWCTRRSVADLVDSGLVSPGAPRLLVWDDAPADPSGGWHVCVLANLWGTNFPMWSEGDGRCRVVLTLAD
jgi:hypothetical protein